MNNKLNTPAHSGAGKRLLCLLCVLAGLQVSACSHFDKHEHKHEHENHAGNTHHQPGPLLLNGDQKWLMDQHTRKVLADMQNRTFKLQADQLSTVERRRLGETLDRDLEKLIRGCTMQGEAHDALHQYLSKLMPAVAAMKSEGGQHEAETVQRLLSDYQDYFD